MAGRLDSKNARISVQKGEAFPLETNEVIFSLKSIRRYVDIFRKLEYDESTFLKFFNEVNVLITLPLNSVKLFEQKCEGLVSLLYIGLPFESWFGNLKDLFEKFIESSFEGLETNNVYLLIPSINTNFQTSILASVFLLYSHFNFILDEKTASQLLVWKCSELKTPVWINELTGVTENAYTCLNLSLFHSLFFNLEESHVPVSVPNYLDAINKFFAAYFLFSQGKYNECFDFLSNIKYLDCSEFLQSWTEVFKGLCLETSKRYRQALVHYRNAVDINPDCYQAIYLSYLVFREIGSKDGQISCLKILSNTKINSEKNFSIQSVVVNSHLMCDHNVQFKALLMLANVFCSYEMYQDAKNSYIKVLRMHDSNVIKKLSPQVNKKPTILLNEEKLIPNLPRTKEPIEVGLLIALYCLDDFSGIERVTLDDLDEIEISSNSDDDVKLTNISLILAHLIAADALFKVNKKKEALSRATRSHIL